MSRRARKTKHAGLDALAPQQPPPGWTQQAPPAGYGAPAKGNTLLNYCGIRTDFIDFTVDRNPAKQGRFLPGTGIPILAPDELRRAKPDYVLILPWNVKDEIISQMSFIREWGGTFIVPVPQVQICS